MDGREPLPPKLPLLLLACLGGWLAGLQSRNEIDVALPAWLLSLLLLVALVLPERLRYLFPIFFALCGLSVASPQRVHAPPPVLSVEATVSDVRAVRSDLFFATLTLQSASAAVDGAVIALRCQYPVFAGSRIQVHIGTTPDHETVNRGPHLLRHGRPSRARCLEEPRLLSGASPIDTLRQRVRILLERSLSPRASGFARALLLGDPAAEKSDRESFRSSGLSHLLAVSGMQVTLVALLIEYVLRRWIPVRVRDRGALAAALAIPAILAYASLAGGTVSVWRATWMSLLALSLRVLRVKSRPLHVLGVSIFLFSAVDPEVVSDVGFWLSVSATTALLAAPRLRGAATSTAHPLREVLDASFRASVLTTPIIAWCFGGIPIFSVLANIAAVPLANIVVLPLSVLHATFVSVNSTAFALPLELSCAALSEHAAFWADLGGPRLPALSTLQFVALVALAIAALHRHHRRKLVAFGVIALLGAELWIRSEGSPHDQLRLTFLDVGQGDACLVDLPDGTALLIDSGPDPRLLQDLLRARRRQGLRAVILTHPHPDHYLGLAGVLDLMKDEFEIGEVWDNGQAEAESSLAPDSALLRSFRRAGVPIRQPVEMCGSHSFAGVTVTVLAPCPGMDPTWSRNDNSIVLRIAWRGRSALFTGDIEEIGESVLATQEVRSDILKVPHHGSRTSSSEELLNAVHPSIAVASQEQHSRYGHPHMEVRERFVQAHIPLWMTSRAGGITLATTGESWEISTTLEHFRESTTYALRHKADTGKE